MPCSRWLFGSLAQQVRPAPERLAPVLSACDTEAPPSAGHRAGRPGSPRSSPQTAFLRTTLQGCRCSQGARCRPRPSPASSAPPPPRGAVASAQCSGRPGAPRGAACGPSKGRRAPAGRRSRGRGGAACVLLGEEELLRALGEERVRPACVCVGTRELT